MGVSQMTTLHIDFETRSAIDLKAVGIDLYSKHPTTDVWCMAFAWEDGDPHVLTPDTFNPLGAIAAHIAAGGVVVAHNAGFELAIWNSVMVPRYGWPPLDYKRVICTMAQAYAMGLPGSLEKAAAAVGIKEQKDLAGGRLMLQMAKPRTVEPLTWWDEPDKLARLYEYCKQDVRVERELEKRLLPLSPKEQQVWQLDYEINQRGFYVDRPAIEAALKVVEYEKARLDAAMRAATANFVGFTTENARLTDWLRTRGADAAGVAKADVLDLLASDQLPDDVRKALLIRQEAGKTSMAKLDKIVSAVSEDGRLRNTLAYHAASTGRWAGRRVQPHNFPRPRIKQEKIEAILDYLPRGVETKGAATMAAHIDNIYGKPLDVLPWCLRSLITAAIGRVLMGADFSNIESRVLAWLAGEEWKLDAFRGYDRGELPDIYIQGYSRTFGIPMAEVKEQLRQIGKVIELAFGFGGGVGAYRTMEKAYNPPAMTDGEVDDAKQHWRGAHPATTAYWYTLEDAALSAVQSGAIIAAGPTGRQVKFRKSGSFLWCQLPSGRVLCYPYPQIRQVETPWGEMKDALTYMTVPQPDDRKKGKLIEDPSNRNDWARISTYGGKLAENVTQATARDLLAEAMLRLEDAGAQVVLHVHDEVLIETSEAAPAEALPAFERIVNTVPPWATGLPISAKGWRARRYGKH
jgi:DNA polymerase